MGVFLTTVLGRGLVNHRNPGASVGGTRMETARSTPASVTGPSVGAATIATSVDGSGERDHSLAGPETRKHETQISAWYVYYRHIYIIWYKCIDSDLTRAPRCQNFSGGFQPLKGNATEFSTATRALAWRARSVECCLRSRGKRRSEFLFFAFL
jgi:hypothetical protein